MNRKIERLPLRQKPAANSTHRHFLHLSPSLFVLFSLIAIFAVLPRCLADTATFSYDVNGRLTSVNTGAGQQATYSYDGAGNLLTETHESPNNTVHMIISPVGTGSVIGPGIACPDDCGQAYPGTLDITLTAVAQNGFQFIGWSGQQGGNDNPLSFPLAGDMAITACFGATNGATDTDGVDDTDEMGPDGNDPGFDGNGDGIPDYQQSNVTSLMTEGGYATLSAPSGLGLTDVQSLDEYPSTPPPDGVAFPFGFFSFGVSQLSSGECTRLTLRLRATQSLTMYYQFGPTPDNPNPHWYLFDPNAGTGAQISHDDQYSTITLDYCDGLRGDDNSTPDSAIIAFGGPAQWNVYSVTAQAGTGGSISPLSQNVIHGQYAEFEVFKDNSYAISSATGCDGMYDYYSNRYYTGAVVGDCTVEIEFVQLLGSLAVDITPSEAASIGAKWRQTGTSIWRDSGDIIENLPIGSYTVEFSDIPEWAEPGNLQGYVYDGSVTTIDGIYKEEDMLCESLDNCNLTWKTGGAALWFEQSYDYVYDEKATQTGEVPPGEKSLLQTNVIGPGTIQFCWRASCSQGEEFLEFLIDDQFQNAISGQRNWALVNFAVPAGNHTLRWQFIRSGTATSESGWAYVDWVSWFSSLSKGGLVVAIEPEAVLSAGARWRRIGTPTWLNSQEMENALIVGEHSIVFKDVAGWVRPNTLEVAVSENQTTEVTATYLPPGEASISGKVYEYGESTPVSDNIWVRLSNSPPCQYSNRIQWVKAQADGAYSFQGLLPDTYYAWAYAGTQYPAEWWANPFSVRTCDEAAPIIIQGTEYAIDKDFQLGDPAMTLPGDVDGDGDVDLIDVMLVIRVLAGKYNGSVNMAADCDGDGKAAIPDAIPILRKAGGLAP